MRKFILLVMLALGLGMLASCESNQEPIQEQEQPTLSAVVVEEATSADREYMFLTYGDNYKWYETCVLMENVMDCDSTSCDVSSVVNIFQVILEEDDETFDPFVVKFTHTPLATEVEVIEGFWVEDCDMSEEPIVLTFEEAYDRAMAADCPKPHSKCCVLRKELGPKLANPQYIFGNVKCQIYVDAETGDASPIDPVL